MRFECTLLRPSHFTWNETGWGFRLIFLQCQCGSIFAGWDPPRVIKHHYSSFTHLGNSLRIQHQLNRVSLILGGFPHQAISAFWLSWSQWKTAQAHGPITSHHSAATPFSNCREPLFVKLRLLLRPLPLVKQRKHEGEVEQCFRDRLNVHWEVQPRWSCAQFLQPQSICLLFV